MEIGNSIDGELESGAEVRFWSRAVRPDTHPILAGEPDSILVLDFTGRDHVAKDQYRIAGPVTDRQPILVVLSAVHVISEVLRRRIDICSQDGVLDSGMLQLKIFCRLVFVFLRMVTLSYDH